MAAMIMRARSLDIITSNQYTYLMRQMSIKDYRTVEPLDTEVEYKHPKALHQAVNILLSNGKVTGSQLLQIISRNGLSLSSSALGELLYMDSKIFDEPLEENNMLVFPEPK